MVASDRDRLLADRLGATRIFATLEQADRIALVRAGTRRQLARGQVLYRQGDAATSIALLLAGRLDIKRQAEGGEDVTLRSLEPGVVVGLSPALGAAHSADVVAATSAEVLLIPAASLRAVFQRDPQIAVRALLQLAEWLADLTDEVEALRTSDIIERTRRKLEQLARAKREIRITHEELAAQVGASRANVSRALKRLEREGTVRLGRGRIALR